MPQEWIVDIKYNSQDLLYWYNLNSNKGRLSVTDNNEESLRYYKGETE